MLSPACPWLPSPPLALHAPSLAPRSLPLFPRSITVQGIQQHPWFTKQLPPMYQQALEALEAQQVGRLGGERAPLLG